MLLNRTTLLGAAFACCVAAVPAPGQAEPFTIVDAIRMAVQTNPRVGEASANRRATEAELHQNQGTLLPQVRLEAQAGPLVTNSRTVADLNRAAGAPPPLGNDTWLPGSKGSIVVRQLLFDGFASIHDIWRQAARVDAAAARVHERSELTALDAAEAYIDVVRYTRLVALAQENVKAHRKILSNVQSRFSGGRAGEGDLEQTKERVDAAEAALIEFRRTLEDSKAKFRNAVGIEPFNLRVPGRLRGLPPSKDQVLAVTLTDNPTIKAGQGDVDAARYAFHATAGAFMPNVSLEGRVTEGNNEDNFFGHYSQESLQVVASWDIFRGGQDSWKRAEASERFTQATMAHARLQREAYESVDKAWSARTITAQRIAKLQSQIGADRKVITAYSKEYDLGQRSLIDLLNGENQLFNAEVSLESAKGVAVFADYQLLAAMGKLLDYLKTPHPVDAEPVLPASFGILGLIPNKLPPILITLPHPGSEPLNVTAPLPALSTNPLVSPPARPLTFAERWSAVPTGGSATALGYASDMLSPKSMMQNTPFGPLETAKTR
jgi:outer membrane protein, adhesin transport system